MVNYFRAMTGLPADIGENAGASDKSNHGALMMKANNALSHSPPTELAVLHRGRRRSGGHANLALDAAGAYAHRALHLRSRRRQLPARSSSLDPLPSARGDRSRRQRRQQRAVGAADHAASDLRRAPVVAGVGAVAAGRVRALSGRLSALVDLAQPERRLQRRDGEHDRGRLPDLRQRAPGRATATATAPWCGSPAGS